ncbi:MAG: RHS repeat-associated core domain-containing protein [Burkholderiaceae bacterium]|nr:RHS repeat-associated core domain-containing protein [Burkholderiaceae bacterium]
MKNTGTARRARAGFWLMLGALLQGGVAQAGLIEPANPLDYARSVAYTYRTDGLVETETVEPDNPDLCVVSTFAYDAHGNRSSVTQANCGGAGAGAAFASRTGTMTFAAVASQVIKLGSGTATVAVPRGLFADTVSNALTHRERRETDPRFGALIKLTGPNDLITVVEVDSFGRKTRERLPDGTGTIWAYCVIGAGLDTTSNSSNCPIVSAAERPDDAAMMVHSEPRDANDAKSGSFTRVYTDRLGREIRRVSESFGGALQPAGYRQALVAQDKAYNTWGALVVQTQAYFLTPRSSTTTGNGDHGATRTDYDVLGRAIDIYTADNNGNQASVSFLAYGSRRAARQSFSYNGLSTTQTNDAGDARVEERTPIGQLLRVTDPNGAQVAHQYEAFGNLRATKDALQNTIAISYDLLGRKRSLADPDAGLTTYKYDALGQLKEQQNARQRELTQITTFDYDVLGRMFKRSAPEYVSNWVYDTCVNGKGRLCETSTTHGVSRKYAYDGFGRLITQRTNTGGPSFVTGYGYDAVTGRLANQTYPSGLQVGYNYAGSGHVESLKLLSALDLAPLPAVPGQAAGAAVSLSAGTVLWQAEAVNAWGRAEQQGLGSGVKRRLQVEAALGRALQLSAGKAAATDVLMHRYSWDSLDNLRTRADDIGDAGVAVSETFGYGDRLNRLTQYRVSSNAVPGYERVVDLQYNALGLLLYKSDVGSYTYGRNCSNAQLQPHALQSLQALDGTRTCNTYSANGNLTDADQGRYRSISYTSFNLPAVASGGGTSYAWLHDENQARLREVRTSAGGVTRTTWAVHPDQRGGLDFEREVLQSPANGTQSSNRHYLSVAGEVVAVVVTAGDLPSADLAPAPLARVAAVKLEYWVKDHLGSLAVTTDHTGAVTARYAYDPFGKRRYIDGRYDETGQLVVDWSPAVNKGTDRGFTGHEHLDDIGLVHMNGRIFDATTGVFLQADPIVQNPGNLQSFHRYGYCLANPLTCTDPSGFMSDTVVQLEKVEVSGKRSLPVGEPTPSMPQGLTVYGRPDKSGRTVAVGEAKYKTLKASAVAVLVKIPASYVPTLQQLLKGMGSYVTSGVTAASASYSAIGLSTMAMMEKLMAIDPNAKPMMGAYGVVMAVEEAGKPSNTEEVLKPGGEPIGTRGQSRPVREVSTGAGNEQAGAEELFGNLTDGGTVKRDEPGHRIIETKEGTFGLREPSRTKSGHWTVDVNSPSVPDIKEVKFKP